VRLIRLLGVAGCLRTLSKITPPAMKTPVVQTMKKTQPILPGYWTR
jgi:hypothetical protein